MPCDPTHDAVHGLRGHRGGGPGAARGLLRHDALEGAAAPRVGVPATHSSATHTSHTSHPHHPHHPQHPHHPRSPAPARAPAPPLAPALACEPRSHSPPSPRSISPLYLPCISPRSSHSPPSARYGAADGLARPARLSPYISLHRPTSLYISLHLTHLPVSPKALPTVSLDLRAWADKTQDAVAAGWSRFRVRVRVGVRVRVSLTPTLTLTQPRSRQASSLARV